MSRDERGQAAVELALCLPLLAALALLLVQVGLLVRDQVVVVHAAREAAREAAVTPGEAGPRRAAVASTKLHPNRLDVNVGRRGRPGTRVRVEVRYRSPTEVPMVGHLLPDVELTASAAMRVEA